MNRILPFLLLLTLVSCANPTGIETPTRVANPKILPTNTFSPPTPLPSLTPTQENSCDPFTADFCITEGHFVLQRPIHPPANDRIDPSYPYGSTANGTRDPHHGVEFSNASGTPVYAAAEGNVLFASADSEAIYSPRSDYYGNLIVIQHDDELFTVYAHLSKIDVTEGQGVFSGQKIGEVGRTGVAIGSHLHFEVRHGNGEDYFATQNPELWLIPAKDPNGDPFGTLMISVVDQNRALLPYAEFTIKYYPTRSGSPAKSYYGTTYAPDMLNGDAPSTPRSGSVDGNAMLGELSHGHYRIAVNANGKMYERWVEVESGKLTQVVFIVE
jgi:hypothetical protein